MHLDFCNCVRPFQGLFDRVRSQHSSRAALALLEPADVNVRRGFQGSGWCGVVDVVHISAAASNDHGGHVQQGDAGTATHFEIHSDFLKQESKRGRYEQVGLI